MGVAVCREHYSGSARVERQSRAMQSRMLFSLKVLNRQYLPAISVDLLYLDKMVCFSDIKNISSLFFNQHVFETNIFPNLTYFDTETQIRLCNLKLHN